VDARPPSRFRLSEDERVASFVGSPGWAACRYVVDRFLYTLSWLNSEHPDSFHVVESVQGKQRLYFSKEAKSLESSGRSVDPRKIPQASYWVITNNATQRKTAIVRRVMSLLGYKQHNVEKVLCKIRSDGGANSHQLELRGLDSSDCSDQI
jgi:negative regulator of replication initiation